MTAGAFVDVEKATIVNAAFVQELFPSIDGGLLVRLKDEGKTELPVARDRVPGSLREVIYLGDHVRARIVLTGNEEFMVKRPISEAQALPRIGAAVEVFWAPEHCRAFARES